MKYKYASVDLRTVKGIKKAKKLKENGWRIISHSPDVIVFEKEVKSEKVTNK